MQEHPQLRRVALMPIYILPVRLQRVGHHLRLRVRPLLPGKANRQRGRLGIKPAQRIHYLEEMVILQGHAAGTLGDAFPLLNHVPVLVLDIIPPLVAEDIAEVAEPLGAEIREVVPGILAPLEQRQVRLTRPRQPDAALHAVGSRRTMVKMRFGY